jgi:hypothetical protein
MIARTVLAAAFLAAALSLAVTQSVEARIHPNASAPAPVVSEKPETCDAMTILHSAWNQTGTAKVFHYTRKVVCH